MTRKVAINKDIEIAIITCFGLNRDKKLTAGEIKKCAKNYLDVEDSIIQKKIERMGKAGFLMHHTDDNNRFIYYLNNDIEFKFTHPPPELLANKAMMITRDQSLHTLKLKEAVQTWIDNLAEPSTGFRGANESGNAVIAACESHLLFHDLINHLPILGIDICGKWVKYRKYLLELDELKQYLTSSLRDELIGCFGGLELHFVLYRENDLSDYECSLDPRLLYKVVLDLEADDEGYNEYQRFLSWLEYNTKVVDRGNYVLWGEEVACMRVPIKDRAIMDAGIPKFLSFLKDIQLTEYIGVARDITSLVDQLKTEREHILKDLNRAMLYAYFPGECQYLRRY